MRGEVLTETVEPDAPVRIEAIDSPYARVPGLRRLIADRGVDPQAPPRTRPSPRAACVSWTPRPALQRFRRVAGRDRRHRSHRVAGRAVLSA